MLWLISVPSSRGKSIIMVLSSSLLCLACSLMAYWNFNLHFHRRICLFSLCVSPERIPRLILAELNATFYCLSAIKEEEKRPRGEDKEDLDGFHNDFLAMMSGMLSVNSSIHHFFYATNLLTVCVQTADLYWDFMWSNNNYKDPIWCREWRVRIDETQFI